MKKIFNKKSAFIILSLVVFSVAVTLVDALIHPEYFAKIFVKIVFFLAFPLVYLFFNKEASHDFFKLFKPKKKGLLTAFLLGLGIYIVITGGFLLTQNIFDYSAVTKNLESGMGITKDNFLYVALYISLLNSFLEEFFFRGFGFILMKKYTTRIFSYILSPILFAFYHVGMTFAMFDVALLLLVMTGLITGGMIFNYLNEKNENIYSSWFCHMFANFAINTCGFILFNAV